MLLTKTKFNFLLCCIIKYIFIDSFENKALKTMSTAKKKSGNLSLALFLT